MELSDATVTLRTPTEADAQAIADAVQASLADLRPWMTWATEEYSADDALQWIRNEIEPGAVPLVILDDRGGIAGSTGLNLFDRQNHRANLGYWLHSACTGHGYATAATRLVANWGLDHLKLQRVEVLMSVENEPSHRVAQRAGALYEGVQRARLRYEEQPHDAHMFAFLPDHRPAG